MDQQARSKLILELTAERDEKNFEAAESERKAMLAKDGDDKRRFESQARGLREGAREVNRRLDELKDEETHDDDRGGIER
jgi:hypothetical protein